MKAEKQFQRLREKAESLLQKSGDPDVGELYRKDFEEVVHELQIQQAELEIQNEELRRAQDSLTQTRNRYANLFHNAPVGYAVLDAEGVIREVNNTLCEMLETVPESMRSKGLTAFVHPEDRNSFLARYKSFFNKPGGKQLQLRVVSAQNRTLHVRLDGARMKDGQHEHGYPDSPETLMLSFSDVTENIEARRRSDRAKHELQELTNVFVTMLERTTDYMYFKDARHRFTAASQSLAELTGHASWRELVGKTDQDIFPAQDASAYREQEREVLGSGKSMIGALEPYQRPDGSSGWVSSNKWPLQDENGTVVGLCGMSRDVTELVQIEQELKHKVSEFETIFDSSALATIYLKYGRRLHRVNKRFARMFGYTQEELVGRHVSMLHASSEASDRFEKEHYEKLVSGDLRQVEYQLKTRDGELVWCHLSGRAVNPPHLDDGVIWIIDDISSRKELEQLKADVERIMIHDLRSPLSGIIGLPQAMQMDKNLNQEQKELLSNIEQAGYRMLMQINLSLDLYKMETGKYVYKPKSIDMCRVLEWVVTELGALAHQSGVRIRTTIDGKALAETDQYILTADELLINTLLTNLLTNAVEASPFGSRVEIMLNPGEGHHRLSIHNFGAVPEDIRDGFFGKYVTKGKDKGTGLGTYSAKLMTEAMGGTISMTTGENSGTTLTLILPESAPAG